MLRSAGSRSTQRAGVRPRGVAIGPAGLRPSVVGHAAFSSRRRRGSLRGVAIRSPVAKAASCCAPLPSSSQIRSGTVSVARCGSGLRAADDDSPVRRASRGTQAGVFAKLIRQVHAAIGARRLQHATGHYVYGQMFSGNASRLARPLRHCGKPSAWRHCGKRPARRNVEQSESRQALPYGEIHRSAERRPTFLPIRCRLSFFLERTDRNLEFLRENRLSRLFRRVLSVGF